MTRAGITPSFFLAALLSLVALPLHAREASSDEALRLLQKMAGAGQKLTYTGVFVYQSGTRSETSRITRLIENNNEYERLEVLDGSPREVIRHNDEISCYLPDNKRMIVEQRADRQLFPTLIPENFAQLAQHYLILNGRTDRIAGIASRQIILQPKDAFRFGHHFWVEPDTGLLLKASLIGEGDTVLESFVFTEAKIGGPIDKAKFAPEARADRASWTVERVDSSQSPAAAQDWLFQQPLPGFRQVASMKRQLRAGVPESTQLIFSDGLASLSLFIEPLGERPREEPSAFSVGPMNVYKRQVGAYQLILMGDVPVTALRYFGDGIKSRKK